MFCWRHLSRAALVVLLLGPAATMSCGGGDGDGDSDNDGTDLTDGLGGGDTDGSGGDGLGGESGDGSSGGGTPGTGSSAGTGSSPSTGGAGTGGSGGDGLGGEGGEGPAGGSGGSSTGGAASGGTTASGGARSDEQFVTVWQTDAVNPDVVPSTSVTDDQTILLPLVAAGIYDFAIDWGDGTSGDVTSPTDPDRQHVYATAGTYIVTLQGNIEGFHFPYQETKCAGDPECSPNPTSDAWKLLEIQQWGPFRFGAQRGAFEHCSNLVITATDVPDLSAPVTLREAFSGCTSLTEIPSIAAWDVSEVTNMGRLFYNSNFNGDVSSWDTSRVINMSYLFAGLALFDADVSGWDTSSATTMARMFAGAEVFNGDLSSWNTSKVRNMSYMFAEALAFDGDLSSWDTSSATNMRYMFANAPAFDADISLWDTSRVTDMTGMFTDSGAFNQDLGGWDVEALSDALSMFSGSGLSSANYDAVLIGWAAQDTQSDVRLGAGTIPYTSAAAAARQTLVDDRAWVITDGGLAP